MATRLPSDLQQSSVSKSGAALSQGEDEMKTMSIGVLILCLNVPIRAATENSSTQQSEDWKSRRSEAQELFHAGQWHSAEQAYVDALRLARTLPDNAKDTLLSLNELALFYTSTRRFDKAERTLSETVALQAKTLGENDPALVNNIHLLGISYRELHRYDEAVTAHQKALRILTNETPERSSDIALTLSALGSVEDTRCDFAKAQQYYMRALDYLEHSPGSSADLTRIST